MVMTRPMAKFKIRSGCEQRRQICGFRLTRSCQGEVSPGQAGPAIVRAIRRCERLADQRHAKRTLCRSLGAGGAATTPGDHRRQRREHEYGRLPGDRRVVRTKWPRQATQSSNYVSTGSDYLYRRSGGLLEDRQLRSISRCRATAGSAIQTPRGPAYTRDGRARIDKSERCSR